jgi:tripartite-type tricarboxylate transporter receptor subunit TctC
MPPSGAFSGFRDAFQGGAAMKRRTYAGGVALLLVAFLILPAWAQQRYPEKPVSVIVPMSPGGGTDQVGRAFAEALKKQLGQSFVVENVPGAGSAIGTTKLHGSKPDGYMLGIVGGFLISTSLQGAAKFAATDLTHLARLSQETFVLAVLADSPWKTLGEFVEASKREPGKITVGTAGANALTHLAAEALSQKTGGKFNIIHFAGGAKEIAAVLGGHVSSGVFSQVEVLPHSGAGGKLRVLAVFSDQRTDKLPAVPTLRELGIQGVPPGPWQGLAGPKGLPEPVKKTLVEAAAKASQDPTWQEFLKKSGLTSAFLAGPEMDAFIAQEIEMIGGLMKSIGLLK